MINAVRIACVQTDLWPDQFQTDRDQMIVDLHTKHWNHGRVRPPQLQAALAGANTR